MCISSINDINKDTGATTANTSIATTHWECAVCLDVLCTWVRVLYPYDTIPSVSQCRAFMATIITTRDWIVWVVFLLFASTSISASTLTQPPDPDFAPASGDLVWIFLRAASGENQPTKLTATSISPYTFRAYLPEDRERESGCQGVKRGNTHGDWGWWRCAILF